MSQGLGGAPVLPDGCVHEFWPTCADEYCPTLRGLICYAGAGAKQLQAAYRAALPGDGLPAVPDQLKKRRELLTAELDSLQTIEPAAHALYDVLSPDQKKDADEMMADHLRRM